MISEHFTRWCWASFSKYFDDNKGDAVLFVEGDDRGTDTTPQFIEFRMNGPMLYEFSKNCYRADVYVNLLVQSAMDSQDAHAFQRGVGKAQSMFAKCIPVFKYGDGPDDDQSQIGVFTLQTDRETEYLKTSIFGQVDEAVRLQQATVEGRYQMKNFSGI